MRNAAADGVALAPYDKNGAYGTVVSDLVSRIGHVQVSLQLIEQAIARETLPDSKEGSANVIVLDDVSPRYPLHHKFSFGFFRAVNRLL